MIFFYFIFKFFLIEFEDLMKSQSLKSFEEKNSFVSFYEKDPLPDSDYAFVSIYSGEPDNSTFGYYQSIILLGSSLKILSPEIDRVLILKFKPNLDNKLLKVLNKVWTHIIIRPYIKWPDEFEISDKQQQLFFKYHAWSLFGYKKVLLLGADIMIFVDLSKIFKFPTPSSTTDFLLYSLNQRSVNINTDFILIEPNFFDYFGLLYETIKSFQIDNIDTPLDHYVINKYFNDRFSIFPLNFLHENGGNPNSILEIQHKHYYEIRAMGVHFGKDNKPWIKTNFSLYSEIWKLLASNLNEQLDIPIYIGTVTNSNGDFFNSFYRNQRQASFPEYDLDEEDQNEIFYFEPIKETKKNLIIFLLLILSLLFLIFHLYNITNFENSKNKKKKFFEFIQLINDSD